MTRIQAEAPQGGKKHAKTIFKSFLNYTIVSEISGFYRRVYKFLALLRCSAAVTVTDVSEQPIDPILKGQTVQEFSFRVSLVLYITKN
jgi:hypothetical protein